MVLFAAVAGCRAGESGPSGTLAFLVDRHGESTRSCIAAAASGEVTCPEALSGSFVGPASPDGRQVLVITPGVLGDTLGVWAPGEATVHFLAGPGTPLREPQWSHDGSAVVYRAQMAGRSGVWRSSASGGPPEQLTTETNGDFEPDQDSAGRVVFASSLEQGAELFVRLPSGAVQRLTHNDHDDLIPRWIPRSTSLSWLSDANGARTLVVGDGSGTASPLSPTLGADQLAYAWSPDGAAVAVVERYGSGLALRVRARDGTEERTLDLAADSVEPTWSPDGAHLAWTSRQGGHTVIRVATARGVVLERTLQVSDADCWLPRWLVSAP